MTTRYRVEYALKTHRRDQFIEWIKALLAVPFVLHSQPTGVYEDVQHGAPSSYGAAQPNGFPMPGGNGTQAEDGPSEKQGAVEQMAKEAHRRYWEIMRDVEGMVADHIKHQDHSLALHSKLKLLVSSIGTFFTPLPLAEAFKYQDARRHISSRRFVPPSFNDIRLILNTAQVMGLCLPSPTAINANAGPGLQLATFDGDVTLYDDGKCLEPSNPVIPRILELMRRDVRIGIVTAAGYTEAARYYERLHGLLEAIKASPILTSRQKENLIIMGGESNFLFQYDLTAEHLLTWVPRRQWILEEMKHWQEPLIQSLLDQAEEALKQCIANLALDAMVVRKERAVGFIPTKPGARFPRECLEETVLVVQKMIEMSPVGDAIPFCVFNGGNDVFVDIGDKSWGVLVCQKYFRERDAARTAAGGNPTGKSHVDGEVAEGTVECRIPPSKTMHVGDQFLSANGANDFRARKVGTTAWVASPEETVTLLDEVRDFMEMAERKRV